MAKTKNKALFTIRRIANRNSRLPRLYRNSRQKLLRFALVIFLAIVGVASLFFFEAQLQSNSSQPKLFSEKHEQNSSHGLSMPLNKIHAESLKAAVDYTDNDFSGSVEGSSTTTSSSSASTSSGSDEKDVTREDYQIAEEAQTQMDSSAALQSDWAGINAEAEASEQSSRQEVLGSGFESIGGFTGEASNPEVSKKGYDFSLGGVGTINSLVYNLKDYFKYIAGSVAVLYLIISALHIILAQDNEGIEKGKKNLFWSIFALVLVFVIDIMVVAFYEGGGGKPGQSLLTVSPGGTPTETLSLFKNIALYFKDNARTIFSYLKTLTGAFAILFIFFAGTQMVLAGGSDEKIEKEKKYLMHVITAFVTILLLDTMIFGFIYPEAPDGTNSPECVEFMQAVAGGNGDLTAAPAGCKSAAELGQIGSNQILGIVRFFETLVGAIAIFFIVYSGITIIASMGEEDTIKKHKTTLLWSLAGLAIVILSNTLVSHFFFVVDPATGDASVDVSTGLYTVAGVTNFIAGFVGVFAVISIIVAGLVWVSNFGNDELANKAKKVILGAIVGVILSVSAYAIVNTITNANSQGGSGTSIGISI